jgi:hypothetical protein
VVAAGLAGTARTDSDPRVTPTLPSCACHDPCMSDRIPPAVRWHGVPPKRRRGQRREAVPVHRGGRRSEAVHTIRGRVAASPASLSLYSAGASASLSRSSGHLQLGGPTMSRVSFLPLKMEQMIFFFLCASLCRSSHSLLS